MQAESSEGTEEAAGCVSPAQLVKIQNRLQAVSPAQLVKIQDRLQAVSHLHSL